MNALNLVRRFIIGSLLGHTIERIAKPELPGAFPYLPIRPIYGMGFIAATDDIVKNFLITVCVETLIGYKTQLWSFDEEKPDKAEDLIWNKYVKLQNNLAFALMMSAANKMDADACSSLRWDSRLRTQDTINKEAL